MGYGSACSVQVLEEIEFHLSSALELDSDGCHLKSTSIICWALQAGLFMLFPCIFAYSYPIVIC